MAKSKRYAVHNVLGHPEGTAVVSVRKAAGSDEFDDYFDGDVFTPKAHVSPEAVQQLVGEGILEEVTDGG